jgi:type I restriction enzyme S subunit
MSDWKKVKIGSCCTITKGNTGIQKAVSGNFPMVTLSEHRITHNEFQFDCEAVIVPLVSSTGHGHASIKRLHYQNGKFALGSILCAVISNEPNYLIPKYLFIYLSYFKDDLLVPLMKGAANVSLSVSRIKDVEIYIPSPEKQQEIIFRVQKIEEKNNLLKNQIDNQKTYLKNLRQQILQDAIEGKLTKEWREKNPDIEPASELLKKIKKEKEKLIAEKKIKKEKPLPPIDKNEIPFELPMDWVWVGISEIGLCQTGDSINESVKSLKYKVLKSGLNYIGTKDVGFEFRGVNYDTSVIIPFDEAGTEFKIAKKGSIFVCIEGGSSGKKIALLDRDVCFGNKLLATQVFSPVSYEYVYLVYQTFLFESEFRNKSKGLRGGVSVNLFKTIKIPLPPLSEQLTIVSKLKTLIQKLDEAEKQIENSLENSKLLTKAILAEAFRY